MMNFFGFPLRLGSCPKVIVAVVIACICAAAQKAHPQQNHHGNILLEGYSIKDNSAVDAHAWTIGKKSCLTIEFEAGPSEGSWADPKQQEQYDWYREQIVNGYKVRVALTKTGLHTIWDEDDGPMPGRVLLVTYALGGNESAFTANFKTKVATEKDLADALLMTLTFNPKSGL